MTIGMVIGLILLPFAWMLLFSASKAHRAETGVPMPSRGAMKSIRRTARKKGISEAEAYGQWLARKQKRAGIVPSPFDNPFSAVTPTQPDNPFAVHPQAIMPARTPPPPALPLGLSPVEAAMRELSKTYPMTTAPKRIRPAPHEPFDFEHLSMMAASYGWTLHKQAGGRYNLLDKKKHAIENPYSEDSSARTDFNHRDLEDFLLTC